MSNHDPRLDAEITVTMTAYQARALRISSALGGPPPEDGDPQLDDARRILGEAENEALRQA